MNINQSTTLGECLQCFSTTAFRLQVLPVYALGDGDVEYQEYLKGKCLPNRADNPWLKRIREISASGRTITNVLALRSPVTPFNRYSIDWWYTFRAEAGERCLFIRPSLVDEMPLHWHDFWIFDSCTVVKMNYGDRGQLTGSHIIREATSVAEYQTISSRAESLAVPIREVLEVIRQTPSELR